VQHATVQGLKKSVDNYLHFKHPTAARRPFRSKHIFFGSLQGKVAVLKACRELGMAWHLITLVSDGQL
jgi:hypothetical protein